MSTSKLYDSLSGIVQILGALNTKIKEQTGTNDYIQITLPSITAAVKLVLQTSENGTSWTTKINYNSSTALLAANSSNGNIATVTNSSGFSTNYAGMSLIITPEQIGSPAAGTYYRYQFITGTSTDSSKWTVGVLGSSSNGDFKTIQSRLSTLESSSGSSGASVGSTIPANLAATASAGSSSQAARADHVHSTSGLVTIDSSSLSSVISVAIVSGSLPSTVSDNVLYFVLGSGESEPIGPHLEISAAPTTGNWQNSIGSYVLTAGTATGSDAVWTKTDNPNFYIRYDTTESNTWVLFDATSNSYTFYRLCSARSGANATSVFASATTYNGFTTQYVAE